jgi:CRP-like cAMP-binding protein
MKRWQRALDDADEWQSELTRGPARHRMLRLLLKLGETSTEARIWLPARHEMGAMLAMTLETASRLVSALRRDGILELMGAHHATVHMPRLLAALKLQEGGA